MGVTVKKLPAVKLFDGLFNKRMHFKSDKAPIKVSDFFDLIYSTLSECTDEGSNDEKVEKFYEE
eukprot:3487748-Ditylum_brightwellii.AAC.1